MSSMSIAKKVILVFSLVFAMIVVLAVVNASSLFSIQKHFTETLDNHVQRQTVALEFQNSVQTMRSDFRGIMLFGYLKEGPGMEMVQKSFAQGYATAVHDIEQLEALGATDEEKHNYKQARKDLKALNSAFTEAARLCVSGMAAEANQGPGVQARPLLVKLASLTPAVVGKAQERAKLSRESVRHGVSFNLVMISVFLITIVCVGLVLLALVWKVTRQLRRLTADLFHGAEQVANAASQIACTAQSLAQGASEQAASLEETSASTEEISATTGQNSEAAVNAAHLVGQSSNEFANAKQRLGEMVVAMEEISGASIQVARILKVIDEIAFQTNILALNAAVEAARAGESGKGFAVVADEVRNLAQRCAQAAKDTEVLIETAVSKSANGTQKVHEVEESIAKATERALEMKTLVDEVKVGSQEQKKGLNQIAAAISQMEQVTQKTAAGAEESASAGEELNAQADTVRGLVTELKRFVEGTARVQTSLHSALAEQRPAPRNRLRPNV